MCIRLCEWSVGNHHIFVMWKQMMSRHVWYVKINVARGSIIIRWIPIFEGFGEPRILKFNKLQIFYTGCMQILAKPRNQTSTKRQVFLNPWNQVLPMLFQLIGWTLCFIRRVRKVDTTAGARVGWKMNTISCGGHLQKYNNYISFNYLYDHWNTLFIACKSIIFKDQTFIT